MRQAHNLRQNEATSHSEAAFGAWFFTHIRTLLYKKMGEENTISAKEALLVSSWICPEGGPVLGARSDGDILPLGWL